jgi:hypothetical protein
MSRDNSVSIATSWTAGVPVLAGTGDISLLHSLQTGASLPWVLGALSTGVKRPESEVGTRFCLVPRSRTVKLYLHSPYVFMACTLINEALGQLYPSQEHFIPFSMFREDAKTFRFPL